jgi:hypothetical protein
VIAGLEHVDGALAREPSFGDSDALLAGVCAYTDFALEILAAGSASAAALRDAISRRPADDRLLLHPVVRIGTRRGLAALEGSGAAPGPGAEALLGAAVAAASSPAPPSDDELRPGGPVVHDPLGEGPLDPPLRALVRAHLTPKGLEGQTVMTAPGHRGLEVLRAAVGLLYDILPRTAAGALRHVCVVGHLDVVRSVPPDDPRRAALFTSASSYLVPGFILVSPRALTDVHQAAEAILHEAIHAKLFDIYLVRSVLRAGYDAEGASEIVAPWNGSREPWPLDRALGALHVYVHLAALFAALADRGVPGMVARCGTARGRAAFLGSAVRRRADDELRDTGRQLVEWLLETLAAMPAP